MKKTDLLLKTVFFLMVSVLVLFVSCSKTPQTYGRLSVKLTDFPTDQLEAVNITIDRIDIHYTGSDSTTGNWLELPVETSTFNLLLLQDGVDTTLFTGDAPAGRINQIRLILSDASIVLKDSTNHLPDTLALKVPSGAQSGLKIKINEEIKPEQDLSLTLDLDASESIVRQGNGDFLLKPVLKLTHISYIPAQE